MTSRRDCANAIRALAMDAVQKANSGHPGMPMGMADIAEVLWRGHLRFNPANPKWLNRDRFVLSNGHGAMLHYALLHLCGFEVSLEDLRQFRQLHSHTPGHPEFGDTPGVETTTGPLGQGLANAVGMAVAETMLAAQFNRPDFELIDHYTYVFAGDGCLMEGISHEACSLAGTYGLGKLIVFYDDNGISIDGEVSGWFSDDTPKRFEAYQWQVIRDVDGHDPEAIHAAIIVAQAEKTQPTLICCKTQIGYGAPNKAGTADSHGAPLGDEEIQLTREKIGWAHAPFVIPQAIYAAWDARGRGAEYETQWNKTFSRFETAHPQQAAELLRRTQGWLPEAWLEKTKQTIQAFQQQAKTMATRKASLMALNEYAKTLPELVGGSADLSGSNCTDWSGCRVYGKQDPAGNYLHYGVREFAMSAMMNGMALHGGIIPFGGTFLVFSDYARNAVRLAALMKQKVIFVYTHDSIGLGEDGPTHQPIEQAAMLRMTPGLNVWRPCDTAETAVAWRESLRHCGPSCLLLSRQNLPHQQRDAEQVAHVARGGYVLEDSQGAIDAILIATGSEVALAVAVAHSMREQGVHLRVVSMPCCEVFKAQEKAYRDSVLPPKVKRRIVIEAGCSDYWHQFVGIDGKVIGIDRFGASAPAAELFREFGFSVDNITAQVTEMLAPEKIN